MCFSSSTNFSLNDLCDKFFIGYTACYEQYIHGIIYRKVRVQFLEVVADLDLTLLNEVTSKCILISSFRFSLSHFRKNKNKNSITGRCLVKIISLKPEQSA